MGDPYQYDWLNRYRKTLQGPVLEVGSRSYDPRVTFDYRALFDASVLYRGVDLQPGDGVDLVTDLSGERRSLPAELTATGWSTVICMSVLEHVKDVFAFCGNLSSIMAPGGRLYVSTPWVWRYHGYPGDYWRFSPEALEYLFPTLTVDRSRSFVHQPHHEGLIPISEARLDRYPVPDRAHPLLSLPLKAYGWLSTHLLSRPSRPVPRVLYPTMIDLCFEAGGSEA